MNKSIQLLVVAALTIAAARTVWADGDRLIVRTQAAKEFAVLPDGVSFPEGITANPRNRDVIVGTFESPGRLLRFDRRGKLLAQAVLGPAPLLGLAYNRADDKVYLASVGDFAGEASMVRRIDAEFVDAGSVEDVAEIPSIGAPPDRVVDNPDTSQDSIAFGAFARVPNALAFTSDGDLLVSDSFQGAVFTVEDPANRCPGPQCAVTTLVHDGLLATAGFPPFGANGLALSGDGATLFVANTGDDRILSVELNTAAITIFAESVDGADGLAMDHNGNLWVAANQADNLLVLNGVGRVIARLGAFNGIDKDGTARGLLFPSSLVIVGRRAFVANLALALRGQGAGGPEPEADVSRFTVSRINIPRALR